jgi:C1A family cysteine protease
MDINISKHNYLFIEFIIPESQNIYKSSITQITIPSYYNVTNNTKGRVFKPICNQDIANCCGGVAVSSAFEFYLSSHKEMSKLFIYYNGRKLTNEEYTDAGVSLYSIFKTLDMSGEGICEEDKWKFNVMNVNVKPPKEAYDNAKLYHGKCLLIKNDVQQMKRILLNDDPIIVGFAMFKSFYDIDTSGRMPFPDLKKDEFISLHASVIIGYDDNFINLDGSLGAFTLRNSWGEEFGDNGLFYMQYDFIKDKNLTPELWYFTKIVINDE